jgi:4-diphosphocytidyl-2-C-methyl-D-erythritol kinase
VLLFPNAKINIGLHILYSRLDGYHDIDTLIVDIGLCDVLEFIQSPDNLTTLTLTGLPVNGNTNSNLVIKAWNLLNEKYSIPAVKIHLHKVIPQGAGLGGGSSDAAFMLKGLNETFNLNITENRLRQYASFLGSDCSFFMDNKPAIISGKGDIITPSPKFIENKWLCLFYPLIEVSTAEAYSYVNPDSSREKLIDILFMNLQEWKVNLLNDFEEAIFKKHPLIGEIKQKIYASDAIFASMSGSGSSVFGIYDQKPLLDETLRKWIIWEGWM